MDWYTEKGSALRWPIYAHLVLWTFVLVIGVLLVLVNPSMSIVPAVGIMGLIVTVALLGIGFRTGIRVGEDGIRIGAVNHVRRRPRRNLPWADAQRKEVFTCPWSAVRRAAVVTDKATLKAAGKLRLPPVTRGGRRVLPLGVLWAPFTKAALLIEVDPRQAVFPEFREPDLKRPLFRPYHSALARPSAIWYVPTRRPAELRAILARHVAPASASASAGSALNTHSYLFEKEDVTLP